jgi:hypothetical protein
MFAPRSKIPFGDIVALFLCSVTSVPTPCSGDGRGAGAPPNISDVANSAGVALPLNRFFRETACRSCPAPSVSYDPDYC